MMVTESGYLMMLFVQKKLFDGLMPDEDGWYIISRKEFINELPMTSSTFSKQINNLVEYYMQQWDMQISFGLTGLGGENLYTDVRYEKGKLLFKRNRYSMRSELQYVWAREPKGWDKREFYYEHVLVPENVKLPIEK